MKKIFYLIVGVLCFIPLLVKADMAGPGLIEYKASITNPDGAYLYKIECNDAKCETVASSEKLPYGKEVTIVYEEDGFVSPENYSGYLRIKDVAAIEKNYSVSLKDLDVSTDAIILVDRKVKTGPAEGYSDTGTTIKKGTSIKIRFFKDGGKDGSNPWAYVEYNGTKGFISIMGASVAYGKDEETFERIANKNAKIIDPSTSKVVGTIPVNTIIKVEAYNVDPWSRKHYLTYNGVSGLVSYYDLDAKFESPVEYTLLQKYDIHETSESDSKVIGSLEAGTVFSTYYEYWDKGDRALYYEAGSTKGWIIPLVDINSDELIGIKYKGQNETNPIEKEEPSVVESKDNESPRVSSIGERLYIYIGIAFAFLVAAVVSIILINKKAK